MTFLKDFFKRFKADEIQTKKPFPALLKQNIDPSSVWNNELERLGEGAFGFIFKAQHKSDSSYAALKRVEYDEYEEVEDFLTEIEILSSCSHDNVLKIIEAYLYEEKLWIYLELCSYGALDRIINTLEKPLTEPQIRFVCAEMTKALAYIHSKFIVHRDLKAGNILIDEKYQIKLADFGVSRQMSSARPQCYTYIGTPFWMSPEVLRCDTFKDQPYGTPADVWSYGITLLELAEMRPPHHEMQTHRVLTRIIREPPPKLAKPQLWSDQFRDFLSKCLVKDPTLRCVAEELSKHSFIATVNETDRIQIKILVAECYADVEEEEVKSIGPEDLPSLDPSAILSPDVALSMRKLAPSHEGPLPEPPSPTSLSRLNNHQTVSAKVKGSETPTEASDYGSDISYVEMPLPLLPVLPNRRRNEVRSPVQRRNERGRSETQQESWMARVKRSLSRSKSRPAAPRPPLPQADAPPVHRSNSYQRAVTTATATPKRTESGPSFMFSVWQEEPENKAVTPARAPLVARDLRQNRLNSNNNYSLPETPYKTGLTERLTWGERLKSSPFVRKVTSLSHRPSILEKTVRQLFSQRGTLRLSPTPELGGRGNGTTLQAKPSITSSSSLSDSHHSEENHSPIRVTPFNRKSTYRTTRRVRRFVVDGKTIVTDSTHVSVVNETNNAQFKSNFADRFGISTNYNQALKDFRMQHKIEARIDRELKSRARRQMSELESKLQQEVTAQQRIHEAKLESLGKQHRTNLDKAESDHDQELKKRLKKFKDGKSSLRGPIIRMRGSLPSESTNTAEQQTIDVNDINARYRLLVNQINNDYFAEKQRVTEEYMKAKSELEEAHMQQRHQMARARLSDYFMLHRQQLIKRQELARTELRSTCDASNDALLNDLHEERRMFRRETKARLKEQYEEAVCALKNKNPPFSHSQFRSAVQELKKKRELEMADILLLLDRDHQKRRLKNDLNLEAMKSEMEEIHAEKLNALAEQELSQMRELEEDFKNDLHAFRELIPHTHRNQIEYEKSKHASITRILSEHSKL